MSGAAPSALEAFADAGAAALAAGNANAAKPASSAPRHVR